MFKVLVLFVVVIFSQSCSGQQNPQSQPNQNQQTQQQRYDVCVNGCRSTFQYNPVCGTDGETYRNSGGITCAQFCGRNVEIDYMGSC